jgi:macrolide-specific efflux system membrane fusion protein
MKTKLVVALALGAVGVGALVYSFGMLGTGSAATTEYLTTTAAIGDVTEDVAATGTLETTASYGLVFGADPYLVEGDDAGPTSETTWPVTDVAVAVGDRVTKGDVLATADTTEVRAALDTATAELRSARISLRAAEDTLEDAEDADVTAQIRQAKIGLINAETQVADAKAKVEDLRAQLAAAVLTAPIDGIVSEVTITAGFDAPSGAAIVVAAPTFQITTDVVESDLADIEVGQPASVTIDALDADVSGTVSAISPVAGDGSSGVVSYPVTITITDAPADARAGMSADVTITIASATGVLTVPASALQGTEGDYRVLTLGADGTPVATPVEVGLVTSTLAEITSGLSEGTAVVTGTASDLAGTDDGSGGFTGGGVAVPIGGGGPPPEVRQRFVQDGN